MYEEEKVDRQFSHGRQKERDRSGSTTPRRDRDMSFQELSRSSKMRGSDSSRPASKNSGRGRERYRDTERDRSLSDNSDWDSVAGGGNGGNGGSRNELIEERDRVGSAGKAGICCSPWRSYV